MKKYLALILGVFLSIATLSVAAYADDNQNNDATNEEELTYYINGYNRSRIISDSDGNRLPDYAYCINYKETPPITSGDNPPVYTRMKLSEITSFTKSHGTTSYNAKEKIRMLKIVKDRDAIIEKADSIDTTDVADYVMANYFDNYMNIERLGYAKDLLADAGVTIENGEYADYKAAILERPEIFRNTFKHFMEKYLSGSAVPQRILWAAVHDDDLQSFLADDGSSDIEGKNDYYQYSELKTYGVHLEDTLTNPYSLWNVFYKVMLDFIDNELPDYFTQGYDAWVYITDNQRYQNMLGSDFESGVLLNLTGDDPASSAPDPDPDPIKNPDTFDYFAPVLAASISLGAVVVFATSRLLSRR